MALIPIMDNSLQIVRGGELQKFVFPGKGMMAVVGKGLMFDPRNNPKKTQLPKVR